MSLKAVQVSDQLSARICPKGENEFQYEVLHGHCLTDGIYLTSYRAGSNFSKTMG
jgi:hypothetical protein